jgi:hypothetical protein
MYDGTEKKPGKQSAHGTPMPFVASRRGAKLNARCENCQNLPCRGFNFAVPSVL